MSVVYRLMRAGCVAGLALALGVAPAGAAPKTGASLPSPVIAVLDVQRILQESLAAKSVQQQLETQRAKFQSETDKEEDGLRKTEQGLSHARAHLGPAAYAARQQELSRRLMAVENHVQDRRHRLDEAFTNAMDTVRDSLLAIVKDVAHERGANIVLVKQQTLWMNRDFDITGEVLKRLDQKLPQVAVNVVPDKAPAKAK
ncbi:MAG TPA: OmpH family outer membrane protein [Alphaproteobacteria bacterium]|nr:OmpH family outer membrane protein [Alphaproteobacteria bacterium]